jgi:RecB family exonuclease
MDVWNEPGEASARATWLQQANKGLGRPIDFPPVDPPVHGHTFPKSISVSALAIAFLCPFRFFIERMAGLLPLDEPIMGIPPLERGNLLHRTLALFTRRCRDQGLAGDAARTAMEKLLNTCADEVLSATDQDTLHTHETRVGQHARAVERARWLGGAKDAQGLLTAWLHLEMGRLDEGWQWLCEEASFDGLSDSSWPFSVAGRVDRIDYHADSGYALWDYKSGQVPTRKDVLENLLEPQILAYVHAAREGRIYQIPATSLSNAYIVGGYIGLRTPSAVSMTRFITEQKDLDIALQRWKEAVARIGSRLASGQFEAEPGHVSYGATEEAACRYCPYGPLCGRMGPGK